MSWSWQADLGVIPLQSMCKAAPGLDPEGFVRRHACDACSLVLVLRGRPGLMLALMAADQMREATKVMQRARAFLTVVQPIPGYKCELTG